MTADLVHEPHAASLAIPQPRGEVQMYELVLVALPSAITCARLLTMYVARKWQLDQAYERELGPAAEALVRHAVARSANASRPTHGQLQPELAPLLVLRVQLTPRAVVAEVWDSGTEAPDALPAVVVTNGGCDLPRRGLRVLWCAIDFRLINESAEAQTAAGILRRQPAHGPTRASVAMRDPALLQRVLNGLKAFDAGEA